MSRRRKSNTNRQGESRERASPQRQWYKVDLHLHTPASSDYEQPEATYLDWLRTASSRELDIIAVTDHNTVKGVEAIRREIEWLTRLEDEGRLHEEERQRLQEWRRLSDEILVLPGFEFTATFGFHILGIFPPETPIRHLEHALLTLNVPFDKLDAGATEVGASADVLTAYEVIRQAGGIPISAHANSTHGVAMRNFPFGGQTKIAYTQDRNLMAMEVTDLETRGYRSTARFFNGSKAEYPRHMHCIQGSDAHRLTRDPRNPKRLGIGERATEMLLDEPSFEALRDLFASDQFDRTRPYRPTDKPVDHLATALGEGANLVQSFYETATHRGGRLGAILADICAFANTEGGTVYVGASVRKGNPKGLSNPKQVEKDILSALAERLTPPLDVKMEVFQSQGANILRVGVPKGDDKPYCLDGFKFFVRNDAETDTAVRDEIVALVQEVLEKEEAEEASGSVHDQADATGSKRRRRRRKKPSEDGQSSNGATQEAGDGKTPESDDAFYLPQMGVEIVDTVTRNGVKYFAIRDLRNGRIVKNVTRKGARKLWNYAIACHEDEPVDPAKVQWKGNVGLVKSEKRVGRVRYDLALRENGQMRVFYGVTVDGMEGRWAKFVEESDSA